MRLKRMPEMGIASVYGAALPDSTASGRIALGVLPLCQFMLIFAVADFPIAGNVAVTIVERPLLPEVLAQLLHAAELAGRPG